MNQVIKLDSPIKSTTRSALISKISTSDHSKVSNESLKLFCDKCGRNFKRQKYKDIHECMFECDHCPKICRKKDLIIHHLKIHFGRKQFICETCGKGYNRRYILERHKMSHLDSIKCKICHRKVKVCGLQSHMKIHEENRKSIECPLCHKMFMKNYSLQEHLLLHDSPNAFQCELCMKSFKAKDSLSRHRREVHERVTKRYKCTRCDYGTNDNRNILKHEKKHDRELEKLNSDIQWVPCGKCGALLRNSKSLWHHKKQVHPESHVVCDICGSGLKTKQHLRKHYETMHKNEVNKVP